MLRRVGKISFRVDNGTSHTAVGVHGQFGSLLQGTANGPIRGHRRRFGDDKTFDTPRQAGRRRGCGQEDKDDKRSGAVLLFISRSFGMCGFPEKNCSNEDRR